MKNIDASNRHRKPMRCIWEMAGFHAARNAEQIVGTVHSDCLECTADIEQRLRISRD